MRWRSQSEATCDTRRVVIARRSGTSQPKRTKLLSYSVIKLTKLPGRARQEVLHHWSAIMRGTIPCACGLSGPQAPFDPGAVENSAGDFLDGNFGGVQHWNAVSLEKRLRRSDFKGHLCRRRVAAVGSALVANLLQAVGLDRQGKQLAHKGFERARQFPRLKIILGQRIISGKYTVLHRQVQAGRRFSRTRY